MYECTTFSLFSLLLKDPSEFKKILFSWRLERWIQLFNHCCLNFFVPPNLSENLYLYAQHDLLNYFEQQKLRLQKMFYATCRKKYGYCLPFVYICHSFNIMCDNELSRTVTLKIPGLSWSLNCKPWVLGNPSVLGHQ